MNTRSTLSSLVLIVLGVIPLACSSSEQTPSGGPTADAGADVPIEVGDVVVPDQATDVGLDMFIVQDTGGCSLGSGCGDGGICTADNVCCQASLACGSLCCGQGQVCSFERCVTPGKSCTDSDDCDPGEYCEPSLAEMGDAGVPEAGPDSACLGGSAQPRGKCLPRPPRCEEVDGGAADGGVLTCLETCEFKPEPSVFEAEVKYSWGGKITPPYESDVMMSPIVIQLDDDDCDGKVTAKDIPEILFNTFSGGAYNSVGTIHAISIVGGQVVEKWSVPDKVRSSSELAAGNFDGQPGNEVVACTSNSVVAFRADGTVLWEASQPVWCRVPSLADLDSDGSVEVIVDQGIIEGATGKVATVLPNSRWIAADIDGDGLLDLVTANEARKGDGSVLTTVPIPAGDLAVGDFDKDGKPEVVAIDSATHTMRVWQYDVLAVDRYKIVRNAVDINGPLSPTLCGAGSAGRTRGGGPPTVADFNGDGTADVALAGGIGYAVFDGKKLMDPAVEGLDTVMWIQQTSDCSSAATGSSIFDFNGDGKAEVVYSDEYKFRVYEGETGKVLWETCNTTGTLIEYPLVADVDNDGHADIVLASNAYARDCDGLKVSGIRILGSAKSPWVRTRRVWNQHSYHVTNVEEDGTIPQHEKANWLQPGLNNFRQNKQPGYEFAASDATVTVTTTCDPFAIHGFVRNMGQAVLLPGVRVDFYAGEGSQRRLLGSQTTTQMLYAAQAERLTLMIEEPGLGLLQGAEPIVAELVVPASEQECRADNNASAPHHAQCDSIK